MQFGTKPKRIDTPAGTVIPNMPNRRHAAIPSILNLWNEESDLRAPVMLAVAEMYIKGVSTQRAESGLMR